MPSCDWTRGVWKRRSRSKYPSSTRRRLVIFAFFDKARFQFDMIGIKLNMTRHSGVQNMPMNLKMNCYADYPRPPDASMRLDGGASTLDVVLRVAIGPSSVNGKNHPSPTRRCHAIGRGVFLCSYWSIATADRVWGVRSLWPRLIGRQSGWKAVGVCQ